MNRLRLLQLRKENNMTQDGLSKILKERYDYDINKSLISRYEKGIHEPNYYFIDLASAVFGVTTDYMMGRSNQKYSSDDDQKKLPVIYDTTSMVAENPARYEYANDDCDLCLIASDDSMTGARISNSDTVFIRKQSDVEHGELAAVQIEGDSIIIRRVLKVNGSIILHPENTSYKDTIFSKKDSKQFKIIGKVCYIKAEVK